MNGIYEGYDNIPEANRDYVEAWDMSVSKSFSKAAIETMAMYMTDEALEGCARNLRGRAIKGGHSHFTVELQDLSDLLTVELYKRRRHRA